MYTIFKGIYVYVSIGIHNIIFGQLGSVAFNMHQVGLSYSEVSVHIY